MERAPHTQHQAWLEPLAKVKNRFVGHRLWLLCSLFGEVVQAQSLTAQWQPLPAEHSSETTQETNMLPAPRINPTGRTIELHSSLRRGDRVLGTVLLQISANDELSLETEGTLALLEGMLKPEVLQTIADYLQGELSQQRLTPAAFAAAGITLSFDTGMFELLLSIPDSALQDVTLNMNNKVDNRKYRKPAKLSGYLNVLAGATHTYQPDSDANSTDWEQSHQLQAALRAFNTVLEHEVHYKKRGEAQGEWQREGTRLVIDNYRSANRWQIGDAWVERAQFQDSADLLGFSLIRDFSLTPNRNIRPTTGRKFTLQRRSDVDVIIDGVVVRRLSLEAGVYDLRDIPLANGSNKIELVITDSSGEVERLLFSVTSGDALLAQGLTDYAISGGVLALNGRDGPEYQQDSWLSSGYFRYGWLPWLTPGINYQWRDEVVQFGGELLIATDSGSSLALSMATSQADALGSGQAVGLSYAASFGKQNHQERRLTFKSDFFSANFTGINRHTFAAESAPLQDTALLAIIDYGQRLTESISAGLGLSYSELRAPSDQVYSVSAALSGSIWKTQASWSLRTSYQQANEGSGEWNSFFNLSWPIGKRTRISVDGNGTTQVKYSYNENAGRAGGLGGNLSAQTSHNYDAFLGGGLSYTGNRFFGSVDHDARFTELGGDNQEHLTRLRFDTSLAFAGSRFAFGRPVGNSFAVVSRHPSLAENKVRIAPDKQGDKVHSDGLGNLLVPDLGNYRGQLLSYEVDELPPGYDLGEGVFAIAPPYKAGYSLQVGSDATITVLGTLLDATTEEPLSLVAGEAIHQQDQDFEPVVFFSNRTGRFAISGLKPGDYQLQFNTQPPRSYPLTIGADETALLRVGELKVN